MGYLVILAIVIIAIFAILLSLTYIRLSRKQLEVNSSWEKIENQLTKRINLIPLIVAVVKDYTDSETLILEELTESRLLFLKSKTVKEKNRSNNKISNVFKSLFKHIDNYGEIKNDEQLLDIKNQLKEIDYEIDDCRKNYNEIVLEFNNLCLEFPNNYFASILGFKEKDYFRGSIEYKNDFIF